MDTLPLHEIRIDDIGSIWFAGTVTAEALVDFGNPCNLCGSIW